MSLIKINEVEFIVINAKNTLEHLVKENNYTISCVLMNNLDNRSGKSKFRLFVYNHSEERIQDITKLYSIATGHRFNKKSLTISAFYLSSINYDIEGKNVEFIYI